MGKVLKPTFGQKIKSVAQYVTGNLAIAFSGSAFRNPVYRTPYDGAGGQRQISSWWGGNDTNKEILQDQETLRNRSRDLVRNNSIGRGSVKTMVTNVVGTGLQLQSQIDAEFLNMSPDAAEAWERTVERKWKAFEKNCDASRKLTWAQIIRLIYLSKLQSGEVFATLPKIKTPGQNSDLKIKVVESDFVHNPANEFQNEDIQYGIEVGENGEPIAYWIKNQKNKYDRVEAFGSKSGRRNVIHFFSTERPGQLRGIPFLAPVIETIKQLGDYKKSELTASVVASLFTIFVKSTNPDTMDDPFPGNKPESPGDSRFTESTDNDYTMGPGAINRLGKEESIETANPGRPNTAFEGFISAVLREIGMALEIPYEILAKQFMASYSASRGAKIEFWKFVVSERKDLVDSVCQPIYEEWLFEQVLSGKISAPGFLADEEIRAAYCVADWIGQSAGQIDGVKEVLESQMKIESGFSTHHKETANLTGQDFEQNVRKLKRERELIGYAAKPANAELVNAIVQGRYDNG